MALTAKQQAFVTEYVQCWNASEAARRAGYSENSARSTGARLLTNDDIQAEISRIVEENAMSAEEVLSRLAEIARGDISDFLEFKQGVNLPYLNLEKAHRSGKMPLVKKFKYNMNGQPEIELHSAFDALVQIGRAHGLFTDKQEITGKDGEPLSIVIDR